MMSWRFLSLLFMFLCRIDCSEAGCYNYLQNKELVEDLPKNYIIHLEKTKTQDLYDIVSCTLKRMCSDGVGRKNRSCDMLNDCFNGTTNIKCDSDSNAPSESRSDSSPLQIAYISDFNCMIAKSMGYKSEDGLIRICDEKGDVGSSENIYQCTKKEPSIYSPSTASPRQSRFTTPSTRTRQIPSSSSPSTATQAALNDNLDSLSTASLRQSRFTTPSTASLHQSQFTTPSARTRQIPSSSSPSTATQTALNDNPDQAAQDSSMQMQQTFLYLSASANIVLLVICLYLLFKRRQDHRHPHPPPTPNWIPTDSTPLTYVQSTPANGRYPHDSPE
ncbi:putative protein TPRXL [Myripristis murdjan]|uniref:putative protein TPRXL n=1 Tax=Myripristis murdjan TaxID=586833 RepID=UPI0011762D12|nr:putative protein TPRXL [Myripristis murdjan]